MKKILTVGLSPAIQRTLVFDDFNIGEVNRASNYYLDAAGKCVNVSRVLNQAGISNPCLTPVGRENQREFLSLCEKDGLRMVPVFTSARVRTCITCLDRKKQSATELVVNEPESIEAEEEQAFWNTYAASFVEEGLLVVISGSKLPGFSDAIIPRMVEHAKKHKSVVIADYRNDDLRKSFFSRTICPDFVKINESELLQTFSEYDSLIEALKQITLQYNTTVIITRGKEATLSAVDGILKEHPTQKVLQPCNPIGCGDAMTAGFAYGIASDMNYFQAIEHGQEFARKNLESVHPGWIL
ncbi:MAG: hypothetical protein EOM15_07045 [Spirochaetia bacterium]|nr:hypothetical protein [Spirochaetia bacterium]